MFPRIKLFKTLAAAISVFLAASCKDDFEPVEYQVFDSLLWTQKITFRQAVDHMLERYGAVAADFPDFESLIDKGAALAPDYTFYGIVYNTVDPYGNPVKASGVIGFPEFATVKGVVEYSPVNKTKQECGTASHFVPEAVTGFSGFILIIPDLIGCGTSSDLPICYFQHGNIPIVSHDMRKAAAEFLYNERHYPLPSSSFIFGYSLGGSGALALARYYDTHPEAGVRVRELYTGAGGYNPLDAVEKTLEMEVTEAAILPNLFWSFNQYEHLGLNFEDMFTGKLRDGYEGVIDGRTDIHAITDIYGSAIKDYLNLDYFSDSNPEWLKIKQALASKAVPIDWKPGFKIHMYHSVDDMMIPHECSDIYYDALLEAGADVSYVRCEGSHRMACFEMEKDFGLRFIQ